jgi:hypothetical protein
MTDRDDLLALMYDDETPTETVAPERSNVRTRHIRVGPIGYEVPTVEYVQMLEQLVQRQQEMLDQHRRAIDRLQVMLQGTRRFVRSQSTTLGDLRHEITRRDAT